jgi:hypothetical protein
LLTKALRATAKSRRALCLALSLAAGGKGAERPLTYPICKHFTKGGKNEIHSVLSVLLIVSGLLGWDMAKFWVETEICHLSLSLNWL